MTTADYILNAVFIFFVLRQTRERKLDARSLMVPLLVVFLVARNYVHSLPMAGNDLVLIGALATVGVALGALGGIATHVRRDGDGNAFARVGWVAGALLIAGFGARMVFVLAVNNGAAHAVGSFSASHEIGAAAWPVALVAMALLEVIVRIVVVEVRARQLPPAAAPAIPVAARA
jgi:hypothetical protein